jgi:hypothetical protein
MLVLSLVAGAAAWIGGLGGLTASYRTYTADYVPDRLADGFDFPVGRNGSAAGYYMARKMVPYNHLGDDWNGLGGGNTDYGDPVYSIADGVVVYSQNYGSNWGQVIIVRHKFKDLDGRVKMVDSLYGHVINRRVSMGDSVRRGQQIAQIGNNNGMYLAHLHLEIRSNTSIGIQSWNFSKGSSNYHRPHQFIASRRPGRLPDARLQLAANEPASSAAPAPESAPASTAAAANAPGAAGVTPPSVTAVAMADAEETPGPVRAALEGVAALGGRREEEGSAPAPAAPKVVVAAHRETERDSGGGSGKWFGGKRSDAERAVLVGTSSSKRVVDELPRRKENDESSGDGFLARLLHGDDASPQRDRRSRKPSESRARPEKKEKEKGLFGKAKSGSGSERGKS